QAHPYSGPSAVRVPGGVAPTRRWAAARPARLGRQASQAADGRGDPAQRQGTGAAPVTEVLIVGGGTVGLSAALFLSRHGIAATVLESRPTTSVHPRAGSINPRTMEL